MALTAKQQRFVEESINKQISALRQVALHVGLIPSSGAISISAEEKQRRIEKYGVEPIIFAAFIMMSSEASPQSKAASALLLDCLVPEWREILGPSAFGSILERGDTAVLNWRKKVFERDGFACRECGAENELHAHHIVRWADCPELRIEISNGLTLCKTCHGAEHAKIR